MLTDAERGYGKGGNARACVTLVNIDRVREGIAPLNPPADRVVSDEALPVYVNHGRWVVDCPNCNSAQLASRSDRRFWCVDCRNVWVQGKWVMVTWPSAADEAAIESVLDRRPHARNANWRPGESVADLIAENTAHGLGI